MAAGDVELSVTHCGPLPPWAIPGWGPAVRAVVGLGWAASTSAKAMIIPARNKPIPAVRTWRRPRQRRLCVDTERAERRCPRRDVLPLMRFHLLSPRFHLLPYDRWGCITTARDAS